MKLIYIINEIGLWKSILYKKRRHPKLLCYMYSNKDKTVRVYNYYNGACKWLKHKTYKKNHNI